MLIAILIISKFLSHEIFPDQRQRGHAGRRGWWASEASWCTKRTKCARRLDKACADPDIGLVLITDKLVAKCSAVVFEYKLTRKRPLIVEMPDRHSDSNPGDSIKRYISEVVGVKI